MAHTIPPKPNLKSVYEDGILLYEVKDYFYVAPGSESAKIFKEGWHDVSIYNWNHPRIKKELEDMRKECEQIRKNAEVDWEKLSRTYITI